jgi:N-acyl-D-amino-acid deacylase
VKEALDDIGGGRNVQITRLPMFPQHVGKRLDQVARDEGLSEVDAYIRLVQDEDAGIIGHTMSEPDLRVFYQQAWTMVASDGGIANNHPRGAGTFPRVLGRLVREQGWLTLPEAVRKMTALPAARLGLTDRGLVRTGMKADLVLLDPATVIDRSTFEQPRLLASGIQRVWVNGVLVWNGQAATGARPGQALARSEK